MATELAKVSLWINSCVEDMPLNFLDHHIKCGNSLIGVTPKLLKEGIPDEAFYPIEGDDKDVAKRMRSKNSFERKNKLMMEFGSFDQFKEAKDFASLDDFLEKSPEDVEQKKNRYSALTDSAARKKAKVMADIWTAAFFWQLDESSNPPPTEAVLRMVRATGIDEIKPKLVEKIEILANNHRFFHWYLEYPDVFARENSGFDCLIGNPPWERIKLQEKEFFEIADPEIANVTNAAQRKAMIKTLPEKKPKLWHEFLKKLRLSESESKFIRFSGRYPLTAKGDINTYAIFAEHAESSICRTGMAGIIVPTGIATDETNKEFFCSLVKGNRLFSLYDFENKDGLFPAVHRAYKFSLITLGNQNNGNASFAFFLHDPDQLKEANKVFALKKEDFSLLNPNTKTCPIFRTAKDAEFTKKIYRKVPVFRDESVDENPWNVRFFSMFHMTNDSHLFKDRESLENDGFLLEGNIFSKNNLRYLPLYEGKMLQLFDHRAASVILNTNNILRQALPESTKENEHKDPNFVPMPRYWVSEEVVLKTIPEDYYSDGWIFGFKNVTSPTNERTFIGGAFPLSAVGNSMPLILFEKSVKSELRALLIANMSCRIFDYISRQKIGGVNLNFFIVSQLPVIPLKAYPQKVAEIIKEAMLELVYTSRDMAPFAVSMGYNNKPFIWSIERRYEQIAKLEAIFAILYRLTREEFEYVFDSFLSSKRQEMEQFNEYRSKTLALRYFDKYSCELG